jgi:hypothetical protein
MKRLGYSIIFTLALATAAPAAQAIEANATHLHNSVALPRNARVPSATYRIRLHTENTPLTQLSIDVPAQLKISRGIEVTNQAGQVVSTTLTVTGTLATLVFAQPVAPDTLLNVDLNGVRTSDYLGRSWLLPVSSRSAGIQGNIPLGIAQIQTSK